MIGVNTVITKQPIGTYTQTDNTALSFADSEVFIGCNYTYSAKIFWKNSSNSRLVNSAKLKSHIYLKDYL
jgi:hypothetical protein